MRTSRHASRVRYPAVASLPRQRMRRRVGRALAAGGYAEVYTMPFASEADWDSLQLPADDARRRALRLANPLTDEEPLLRTTLLPGLLRTLARNIGRGFADAALFEMGRVFRPEEGAPKPVRPPVDRGPTAGGTRRDRGGPPGPAAARGRRPGRRPRTRRLVGREPPRDAGRTRSRPPVSWRPRPAWSLRSRPTSTPRGTRAAARPCTPAAS